MQKRSCAKFSILLQLLAVSAGSVGHRIQILPQMQEGGKLGTDFVDPVQVQLGQDQLLGFICLGQPVSKGVQDQGMAPAFIGKALIPGGRGGRKMDPEVRRAFLI